MKPIFQINHRYGSIMLTARASGVAPKTDFNYQATTLEDVRGRRVGDCKPPFHALSRDYFASEAHHDFASEAVVFCLLMMTTVVPLLDGASAVVELIRSTGAAF
ncbi:MAG TPA: hypothetical protein VHQ95_04110 [Pyrinomonadaceae bacterium]|jgi:hypothetical protein|nr:hypothetical protein [Pyrinomonadaceae bacterium]